MNQAAQGAAAASPAQRQQLAWAALHQVLDPEVPALSVCDLGLVREVTALDVGVQIVLTPTYSGCPATEVIQRDVIHALEQAGLGPVRLSLRRAPAWSSDWISEEGRRKLRDYGIAPPAGEAHGAAGEQAIHIVRRAPAAAVECPRCGSANTECLSAFGSTACKALYRCVACREPFEYFKPI